MRKKFISRLQSILFGYKESGTPAYKLKLSKSITTVYPRNIHREQALLKTWKVSVTTAEPDVRYETHAAWMLHILMSHSQLIADIADREHFESRQAVAHYRIWDVNNTKTVKPEVLKKHEL